MLVILKEGIITHSLSYLAGREGGDNFLELILQADQPYPFQLVWCISENLAINWKVVKF